VEAGVLLFDGDGEECFHVYFWIEFNRMKRNVKEFSAWCEAIFLGSQILCKYLIEIAPGQ